jgi:DNA/RNA-binding domain of Phe-tRNA-synthetase-like protein
VTGRPAGDGAGGGGDPELVAGPVDPRVAQEHPGLGVVSARVAFAPGPTPPEVRERLRRASDRWRGPQAVVLRTRPVPWAYRVLFRHLGLDPDVTRTPVEALVLERLLHGGLRTHGMPDDALALGTLETGVALVALDADRVTGAVGIGLDERIVLADAAGPVGPLFGPAGPEHAPGRRTRALALVAVVAPAVPALHVEEALWTAAAALPTVDASS